MNGFLRAGSTVLPAVGGVSLGVGAVLAARGDGVESLVVILVGAVLAAIGIGLRRAVVRADPSRSMRNPAFETSAGVVRWLMGLATTLTVVGVVQLAVSSASSSFEAVGLALLITGVVGLVVSAYLASA